MRRKHKFASIFLISIFSLWTGTCQASCKELPLRFFGINFGVNENYPKSLVEGIRREGSARFIDGVGFESIDGVSQGIQFVRIMAFTDRGAIVSIRAVGGISNRDKEGLAEITRLVSDVVNVAGTANDDGSILFKCEDGITLSIKPTIWDGGTHKVLISVTDEPANNKMKEYIHEYCADSARRKPGDACK